MQEDTEHMMVPVALVVRARPLFPPCWIFAVVLDSLLPICIIYHLCHLLTYLLLLFLDYVSHFTIIAIIGYGTYFLFAVMAPTTDTTAGPANDSDGYCGLSSKQT